MAAIVEEESSEPELHGVPLMLRASWKFGRRVFLFMKAAVWLLLTAVGAFADQYDVVDVQSFVKSAFADSAKLTMIVAGATVVWILLKHFLSGPKGFSAKSTLDEGN